MVVNDLSTRKVRNITKELIRALNEQIEGWNELPLDGCEFPLLGGNASCIKVRRNGAVLPTRALNMIGINNDGYREILGLSIGNSETNQIWKKFFKSKNSRGLTGV